MTKTTTIRIENWLFKAVKSLNLNLSEFVSDMLIERLLVPQEIEVKLKKNEKQHEMLLELQKRCITCNTEISDISRKSPQELAFLLETKVILKESPEFLNGRINLYSNTFGKVNKPTRKQFLELLDNIM